MLAVGEQQALVSRVEIHVKFLGFGFYFHGRKGLVFEIKTRATIIDTSAKACQNFLIPWQSLCQLKMLFVDVCFNHTLLLCPMGST